MADVSIYIKKDYHRRYIGESLFSALIKESEKEGIWTLQSHIIEINKASIALHTKAGFCMVGYREKITGNYFGVR